MMEKNIQFLVKVVLKELLIEFNKEFLGEIPINPDVGKFGDMGTPIVEKEPDNEISKIYIKFSKKIKSILSLISKASINSFHSLFDSPELSKSTFSYFINFFKTFYLLLETSVPPTL